MAISLGDDSQLFRVIKLSQQKALEAADVDFAKVANRCNSDGVTWSVRNGVYCKLIGDYHAPIVPACDRELVHVILLELHASALGGHLAYRKMYDLAKSRFWWKTLRLDVLHFCKGCNVC